MQLIQNRKQFKENYPYKNCKISPPEYPKRYPCIMEIIEMNGGLGGDYKVVEFTYINPKWDLNSFLAGFKAGST